MKHIELVRPDPTGAIAVEAAADALGNLLAQAVIRHSDQRVASGQTITAGELDDMAFAAWQRAQTACGDALGRHKSDGAIAIRAALATRQDTATRRAPKPRARDVEFTLSDGTKRKTRVTEISR